MGKIISLDSIDFSTYTYYYNKLLKTIKKKKMMKIKKVLFTLLGFMMTLTVFGQDPLTSDETPVTTENTSTCGESKLSVDGSIFSRKVENGIGFSSSAAVTGTLTWNFCDWASLASSGVGINSSDDVIGSSIENSLSIKNKNKRFTVKVGDLFYFNGETLGSNDYFNYGSNTSHFVNASLRYGSEDFFAVVRGTVYKSDNDKNNGVFIGAGYHLTSNLVLDAGYLTDASTVDFRTKEGLTHFGLTATKDLHFSDDFTSTLKVNLSVNPTENVAEVMGISGRPVQFGVGLIF